MYLCDSGFEGCSMVPSIYPLETLHNSLSLKQVDEFLNKVCESRRETLAKTLKSRQMNMLAILNFVPGIFVIKSHTILYILLYCFLKLCLFDLAF